MYASSPLPPARASHTSPATQGSSSPGEQASPSSPATGSSSSLQPPASPTQETSARASQRLKFRPVVGEIRCTLVGPDAVDQFQFSERSVALVVVRTC